MYILFIALLIIVFLLFFSKPSKIRKNKTSDSPVISYDETVETEVRYVEPEIRFYTPGPKLSRDDDALYAVVHAAVSQALSTEGVDPESGFILRAIKPVRDADAKPLSLSENEALYAVIMASVGQALSLEGINPEGGFAIRSIIAV